MIITGCEQKPNDIIIQFHLSVSVSDAKHVISGCSNLTQNILTINMKINGYMKQTRLEITYNNWLKI